MDQAGKKKVDAILLLARASFGGRRRRSLIALLVILAVLVGIGVLGVLYFLPQASLPQLILAAYDQVGLPDEEIILSAKLEPITELPAGQNLSGCALFFQELSSGGLLGKTTTSTEGSATLKKSLPSSTEVMVRFPGDGERRSGAEAKARVFIWPADSSVVVVDAVSALADLDATKFDATSNLDVRPRAGAAAALRALGVKHRIAYLAPGTTRALSYNKLSAWLERAAVPQDKFPDGPALAPAGAADELWAHDAAASLRSRFKGAGIGITGSIEHAKQFQEASLTTFLLSETKEAPEGVIALKSWKELVTQLSRVGRQAP